MSETGARIIPRRRFCVQQIPLYPPLLKGVVTMHIPKTGMSLVLLNRFPNKIQNFG